MEKQIYKELKTKIIPEANVFLLRVFYNDENPIQMSVGV